MPFKIKRKAVDLYRYHLVVA